MDSVVKQEKELPFLSHFPPILPFLSASDRDYSCGGMSLGHSFWPFRGREWFWNEPRNPARMEAGVPQGGCLLSCAAQASLHMLHRDHLPLESHKGALSHRDHPTEHLRKDERWPRPEGTGETANECHMAPGLDPGTDRQAA